jgi:predicted nucleic-acid-binding Zn-ribbon protein
MPPGRRPGLLTVLRKGAENGLVGISWFAKEYERTCAECGYSWRVPRSIARRGTRTSPGFRLTRTTQPGSIGQPGQNDLARLQANIISRAEQMEAFRICAKCGIENFTQRPVGG